MSIDTQNSARLNALRALIQLETGETPLSAIVESLPVTAQNRAATRELATGATRIRAHLDWSLEPLLKKPLERLDAPVRAALRLAMYERAHLQTPPFVVANEYAGLMRVVKLTSAVGFVNAIARRLPGELRPSPSWKKSPLTHLEIETSHPKWLIERWQKRLGWEDTRALCHANNQVAPLSLRVNTRRSSRLQVLAGLKERALEARESAVSPDGIIVERAGSPIEWPEWTRGEIIAQDEAAQLVALLVEPQAGQIVFDLASAPGGKTTHLAQMMNDQGRVVAADRATGRLKLVRENAARLGLNCIESFDGDALQVLAAVENGTLPLADVVLLDAPCSGTGTLRRRPDLKWRKTPAQLQELMQLQSELLEIAAPMVKSGGTLLYSTCSLEPEENTEQITEFLARHPDWHCVAQRSTAPHRDGCDGMFAAKLIAP